MKSKIKIDTKNYRSHSDKNKRIIHKSLKELGAGRSILIDSENEIIAGNETFQQAEKLKIPIKIIETDGTELIAIKRNDLKTSDKKRKELALIDNYASDTSEFDFNSIDEDFNKFELDGWEFDVPDFDEEQSIINTDSDSVKQLNTIKWDNKTVFLSEKELIALNKKFDLYIEKNGVSTGFINHLLK